MAVGVVCAARPPAAHACGGTFCDRGGAASIPQRVDQSGENILFVEADGYIEAHVQIRYQGDPASFAWLVPMSEVPEVSIGSQPLFDSLVADSVPVYGVRTTIMGCTGDSTTSEATGCGPTKTNSSTRGGTAADQQNRSAEMMDPIGKTVGSFDVTILQPKSSDEVLGWLTDNGFQLPARSLELVGRYVDGGSVFAAVRLVPGAGVKEIHPIVFRYHATRPSIPIQLTAVAATTDMRVRVFVLGAGRMVPSNYRHVELDDARLDWPTFAGNYETAVARAVDETGDGLGFVTEYAGPSNIIGTTNVLDSRWDADAFLGKDPSAAIEELKAQGQMTCQGALCVFPHPLVLPLLQRYIPAPAGTDENAFYGCLECARDKIDLTQWDAEAFARDYRERVVEPAKHARDLIAQQPYLTRLTTYISPDEMTTDPVFHERADFPDVDRTHWANLVISCDGANKVTLPDGRAVMTRTFYGSWPSSDSGMPYAETVTSVALSGESKVELDNGDTIDKRLKTWNARESSAALNVQKPLSKAKQAACRVSGNAIQQSAWFGLAVAALLVRRKRARTRALAGSRLP
jgi:hypothetical protein